MKKSVVVIRMSKSEYDALVIRCINLKCSINTFVRSKILEIPDEKIVGSSKIRGRKLTDPRGNN